MLLQDFGGKKLIKDDLDCISLDSLIIKKHKLGICGMSWCGFGSYVWKFLNE